MSEDFIKGMVLGAVLSGVLASIIQLVVVYLRGGSCG